MERIQSAIAKARAQRAAAAPAQAKPPAPEPAVPAAPPKVAEAPPLPPTARATPEVPRPADDGVAAAWAALAPFRPDREVMERRRLVALEGGRKTAHLDVMRTRVIQQMRANGWRRLAITSPGPGCGKTTTCLNLAFSLGRQPDLRTILAEVDLRRPSLAKTLGLRERQSFGEVLAGHAALGPNAVRYGTNLALSSNHGPVRNTSELLQGASVRPALAAIEAEFAPSLMIFDLPPMLASDDAMAFVPHVDAVLIVAAAERSTVREVDLCERELAVHTNVMGVVLNKCRFLERELDYSSYA